MQPLEIWEKDTAPSPAFLLFVEWFSVPGDVDDFIFFKEDQPAASER